MRRYSLALENTVGMGAYGLQCASSFVQLLTLAVGGWGVEYSVVTVLPSHGLNPGNTVCITTTNHKYGFHQWVTTLT